MAYGLLQAAIEEAAETVECSHVKIAAEFEDLQARAIRSMRESALATIDLFEAMGAAQMPGEFAKRQLELARRRHETVNDRLVDFFESARNIASIMTDPLSRQLRALACAKSAERGAPEAGDSILSRVNTLTGRQKVVLGLLTEGLPNKVIAHQLSISETTVKAHVGEILRKLKVYNRARVIVMLAQFDMRQT
jgi:ATP/maltotriose-dependent transcriptional regulator MalT